PRVGCNASPAVQQRHGKRHRRKLPLKMRAFVANLLTAHCGRTPGSVRRLKSTFTRPLVAALRACALGGGMLGACGLAGCAQTADPNANTAGSVSAPGGTTFPAGSVGASGTSSPS